MKITNFWSFVTFTFLMSFSLLGCSVGNDSTKPITRTAAYPRVIERARKDNRHFIMHSGKDTFVITSVLVERSKQQFTVHLNRLDSLRRAQINNPNSLGQKQIHVYMQDSASYTLDEPHTIPFTKIVRIEL